MAKRPFHLEPSWENVLAEELDKPYLHELASFIEQRRQGGSVIYPPDNEVFNALWKTPYDEVKVVIIGQDPYHGPNQAHGLCFSVNTGIPIPPSLQNIHKELHDDLGITPPDHGNLERWAEQGVLLLNATLTVEQKQPLSHHNKGWETFTNAIVAALCRRKKPVVFLLWGKNAQEKCQQATKNALFAAHPSPFSAYRGFFGCRHFSKANEMLEELGIPPIDWRP